MAQVKDPVCGMTIESATAAGQAAHDGRTYFFCSDQCQRQFEQSPEKFVGNAAAR